MYSFFTLPQKKYYLFVITIQLFLLFEHVDNLSWYIFSVCICAVIFLLLAFAYPVYLKIQMRMDYLFCKEYQPDFHWGAAANSYFDLSFGTGASGAGSTVSPSSISSGNSSSSLSYNVSPYTNINSQTTRGSKSQSALINGKNEKKTFSTFFFSTCISLFLP